MKTLSMIVVATLFSTAAYAADWPADGTGNAGASSGLNNAIGEGRNSSMVCVNGRCFTQPRR